jgi:hypothetical protein
MMTVTISSAATAKVLKRITAANSWTPSQVLAQNVAADLVERATPAPFPIVHVYCEKIANSLDEKFRSFSGKVKMAIELRHSQDRLEGLEEALQLDVDTVASVLTAARGDWSDGMFYSGAYEVAFSAVKRGGKNFIQVAKVTFEIGVSKN